jgi:hypothetical protein
MAQFSFSETIQAKNRVDRLLPPSNEGALSHNAFMSQSILQDDLGNFSDSRNLVYDLSDEQRDRLIAHARQDAAHATINSIEIINSIRSLKLWIIVLLVLQIAVLATAFGLLQLR